MVGKPHHPENPDEECLIVACQTLHLVSVISQHPLAKGFMMRKTGVWWTPDKSADDDGIPVNDVIVSVSLH